MRTDTTICINSKVNGKQPSLEHRIYSIEGIAPALTTGFHYLIGYYEERALGADAPENNLTGGEGRYTTTQCWIATTAPCIVISTRR